MLKPKDFSNFKFLFFKKIELRIKFIILIILGFD